MNSTILQKNLTRTGIGLLAAIASIRFASAQEVNERTDEEVHVLSPFVVTESDATGYRATSTLAGTRIRTNLSDIGAAISVITSEVFKDVGATNAETILPYSVNTEVAGVQGNFADVSLSGNNRVRNTGAITASQSATRVRGLSGVLLARGMFQTDIPFDSYNTSSLTINRGPNSLLFGATTPGGVMDQSLIQATSTRDFGEFSLRIGERGSHRETLQYNKTLIDDRLAIRIASMNEEFKFQQRPTFKKEQRFYAALEAVLSKGFENGVLGRTTLRGNFEVGEFESNPPKVVPPADGVSDWLTAPDPALENYTGIALPEWAINFVPKQTIDQRGTDVVFAAVPFPVLPHYWEQMAAIYHQPNLRAPSVNLPGLAEVAGLPNRVVWRGVGGRDTWQGFATQPFFGGDPANYTPGFTVPVVMNPSVLDNQNMSISGMMPYRDFDFDVQSVALEQELFKGAGGIEIAYDRQSYDNDFFDPFSSERNYELKVDVMEYLANDRPNPNLGRVLLSENNPAFNEYWTERESKRATAFYKLDFTGNDNFTRHFGRHVFTGVASRTTANFGGRTYANKWVDVPGSGTDIATIMNGRLDSGSRNVPLVVYMGDSLLGSNVQSLSDLRLNNYINVPILQPGDQAVLQYHSALDSPENTTGPGAPLDQDTFQVYRSLTDGWTYLDVNDSVSASWQSFLFDGNLVGLVGWRNDRFKTIDNMTLQQYGIDVLGMTPPFNIDGLLPSGEFDERRIRLADESDPNQADRVARSEGDTLTWSLVGHLPRKWVKLPFDAGLTFHYSESESFVPGRSRRDFEGNPISPESGKTTEYGFTVDLLDQKLSLKANWFKLKQKDANAVGHGLSAPGGIVEFIAFWNRARMEGIPFEDALRLSYPSRPVLTPDITNYDDMIDALFNVIPEAQRELFNPRFSADGLFVLTDPNPGQSVTTNAASEGFELELVGNITRNWRVMANWATQETITTDTAVVASKYVLGVAENLQRTGLANVSLAPNWGDLNTIGSNWNTFQVSNVIKSRAKDGAVSPEQRKHRVNLVTSYSFLNDSILKGLTIGGAIRWQSSIAIGYQNEVDPSGIVTPILSSPYMGPEEFNGDVWVGYERPLKLFGQRVDWKIQLNVSNAIGDDEYIPVLANPDGTIAVVRNPPTQEWFLTNTFSF